MHLLSAGEILLSGIGLEIRATAEETRAEQTFKRGFVTRYRLLADSRTSTCGYCGSVGGSGRALL